VCDTVTIDVEARREADTGDGDGVVACAEGGKFNAKGAKDGFAACFAPGDEVALLYGVDEQIDFLIFASFDIDSYC
jgi:hypothetical protein